MPMVLRKFRPLIKNTLRGFAEVELPSGLVISEITVHQKNDSAWAMLPSVPWIENGQHKIADGKPQYKKIMQWRDRDLSDGFSAALVALVREQFPTALS